VRSLEFKPDVTVQVRATAKKISVLVNGRGSEFATFTNDEPVGKGMEQRYPGLTAVVEELRKPLAEDECWIDGRRKVVFTNSDKVNVSGFGEYAIDHVRRMAEKFPEPEGWPRILAIAERLLVEREPKIEARWEGDLVLVLADGEEIGEYCLESSPHDVLDRYHPGAWEKHVLPCILKNRPLADNEYRQDDGRMIWQFEARVGVASGMPQVRVRYVTDDGSFGQWCSRDRRDLVAEPVWAAAFDYLDRMFPPPQHAPEKVQSLETRIKEIANKHQCSTAAAVLLYLEDMPQ
jgi:hypothetical protein